MLRYKWDSTGCQMTGWGPKTDLPRQTWAGGTPQPQLLPSPPFCPSRVPAGILSGSQCCREMCTSHPEYLDSDKQQRFTYSKTYISKHSPYRFLGMLPFGKTKINPLGHPLQIFLHYLNAGSDFQHPISPSGASWGGKAQAQPLLCFIPAQSQAKTLSLCHNYQMVFLANWQQTPFGVSVFWLRHIVRRIQEPARLALLFNTKIKLQYN